jgi:hypothetical protein
MLPLTLSSGRSDVMLFQASIAAVSRLTLGTHGGSPTTLRADSYGPIRQTDNFVTPRGFFF